MSRWVRVSADIFEHDFFSRSEMSEREAWLWLITKAAWKETRHRIGGTMHVCERGSLFTTLRTLADAWGWKSDTRIRAFLDALEREGMIERKSNAGKTQIFIKNYDTYQSSERKENAEVTQEKRTENALKIPVYQDTTTLDTQARDVSPNELAEQLFTASGGVVDDTQSRLHVVAEPLGWLRAGADLRLHVLPTVTALCAGKPKRSIRSWAFFTQAIADARDRSAKGLPPPSPVTTTAFGHRPNGKTRTVHDAIADIIAEGTGFGDATVSGQRAEPAPLRIAGSG